MNIIFLRLALKMITFLTDRACISPPFTLHLPSFLPCLLGRSVAIHCWWDVECHRRRCCWRRRCRPQTAKRRPQFERWVATPRRPRSDWCGNCQWMNRHNPLRRSLMCNWWIIHMFPKVLRRKSHNSASPNLLRTVFTIKTKWGLAWKWHNSLVPSLYFWNPLS